MHPTGTPVETARLLEHPLFSRLDRQDVTEISHGGWIVEQARGVRVLSRGDTLDGLYLVLDGRLKLYMLSCNGDERVLRVLQEGDSFGEAVMFNRVPSPVFVDTLADCRLAYFPRDVINAALTSHPDFAVTMLQSMSALMRDLIRDLEACCLQNALQRTVNYLLHQVEMSPPPHVALTLPAPKAVVASMLNMSAETFSRELHRLQDHAIVRIDRRVIHLVDKQALRRISRGENVMKAE